MTNDPTQENEALKPLRSQKVDSAMVAAIEAMLARGFYQHQIAALLGINQGRVSEVKTGKRG